MPSKFKKVNNWLHKWLGLITGVVVVIVCLTGCVWVFQEEITGLTQPELSIEEQNTPVLLPSNIHADNQTIISLSND